MTTLNEMGIPGVGEGILRPMLRYQFRIRFLGENNEPLDVSDQLSRQVVRTSPIRDASGQNDGQFSIAFEDDIKSNALKGLLALRKSTFSIAVETMDGSDNVLRTIYLKDCSLDTIKHSELDYAGGVEDTALSVEGFFPQKYGKIKEMIESNPVAAAVSEAIAGAHFKMAVKPKNITRIAQEIVAQFEYEEMQYDFRD